MPKSLILQTLAIVLRSQTDVQTIIAITSRAIIQEIPALKTLFFNLFKFLCKNNVQEIRKNCFFFTWWENLGKKMVEKKLNSSYASKKRSPSPPDSSVGNAKIKKKTNPERYGVPVPSTKQKIAQWKKRGCGWNYPLLPYLKTKIFFCF